jgi:WD repeat and SOF domain-containing protein 1
MNLTIANEDSNLYTYDMRKLDKASMVHKDHNMAVMSVSYSPTGREFVTGGYDKMLRLWDVRAKTSKAVYYTKRMQRIWCANFTADGRFVLSGSDDTNIRIWKARASEKLGRAAPRERAAQDYRQALKRKFEHLPEVRKLSKQQFVPAVIHKAKKLKRVMEDSARRKETNRRAHAKAGAVPFINERKKAIVQEET